MPNPVHMCSFTNARLPLLLYRTILPVLEHSELMNIHTQGSLSITLGPPSIHSPEKVKLCLRARKMDTILLSSAAEGSFHLTGSSQTQGCTLLQKHTHRIGPQELQHCDRCHVQHTWMCQRGRTAYSHAETLPLPEQRCYLGQPGLELAWV